MTIPAGFAEHFRKSKFTEPWEPIYSKVEEDSVTLGVILRDVHCNSRGLVHGAFLAALADNAIGLSCGNALRKQGREAAGLVTTNLSIDYIGRAEVGEWIQTKVNVLKTGRTLCVATASLETETSAIARANATFQVV